MVTGCLPVSRQVNFQASSHSHQTNKPSSHSHHNMLKPIVMNKMEQGAQNHVGNS